MEQGTKKAPERTRTRCTVKHILNENGWAIVQLQAHFDSGINVPQLVKHDDARSNLTLEVTNEDVKELFERDRDYYLEITRA